MAMRGRATAPSFFRNNEWCKLEGKEGDRWGRTLSFLAGCEAHRWSFSGALSRRGMLARFSAGVGKN